MKRFAAFATFLGLTLFGLLVAYSGADEVIGAVKAAGWATLIVVVLRAVAIAGAGAAWLVLFPAGPRPTLGVSVLLRFVREAINQLLPVGQVGGDVIGARLATFWRVDGSVSGAVTIADVAVQAATQAVFATVGLVVLFALEGDTPLVRYATGGLVLGAVLIGFFFVLQARFGARLFGGILRRVGPAGFGAQLIERLWAALGAVYADKARVARAVTIHGAIWFLGTLEVYAALHFMGYPVTLAEALVVESLGQAVRGAAFAVPGGIGVQEGGYVALCALFGVPAGPAIALSLVKRVADLVLGLPFLGVWQVIEGRRAFRGAGRGPAVLSEARG